MSGMDVLGLIVCWGGAVGVAYVLKEPVVSVVALAGGLLLGNRNHEKIVGQGRDPQHVLWARQGYRIFDG